MNITEIQITTNEDEKDIAKVLTIRLFNGENLLVRNSIVYYDRLENMHLYELNLKVNKVIDLRDSSCRG